MNIRAVREKMKIIEFQLRMDEGDYEAESDAANLSEHVLALVGACLDLIGLLDEQPQKADNYQRGYDLWCALMRARGWINVEGECPTDVDELWQDVGRLQSEPDYCLPPTRWYVNPAIVEQLGAVTKKATEYLAEFEWAPGRCETCDEAADLADEWMALGGRAHELARAIIDFHNSLRSHTVDELPF